MSAMNAVSVNAFETSIANERTNLLRFCTYLTGSAQAAEDLTQETLLTAWRRRHTITDASGISHWLTASARNVCRNWQRSQARRQKYVFPDQHDGDEGNAIEDFAADFDLDIELERDELITLLDRAMDLLPPETRGLLIQHYVEETPQAELAAQVGLSTGAVGVRIHRGKLALRKALVTDLYSEAVAHGLVTPAQADWVETRMWCMRCGKHRLQGRFNHAENFLHLRCPACYERSNGVGTITYTHNNGLRNIKAFKPAYARILNWCYAFYLEQANAGVVSCQCCGRALPLQVGLPPWASNFPGDFSDMRAETIIYDWCDQCKDGAGCNTWSSLALSIPQVQQFWRDHPRMVKLPERHVEIANSPAVLVGYANVTDSAKIEVAFSTNTFEIIYVG